MAYCTKICLLEVRSRQFITSTKVTARHFGTGAELGRMVRTLRHQSEGMTNYRIGPHRIASNCIELHRTMSDYVCK